jgi:microcystin-dependent protein
MTPEERDRLAKVEQKVADMEPWLKEIDDKLDRLIAAANMGKGANRLQVSTTVSTTNASASAIVASATGLAIGMKITSANVPTGTTITAISTTTITMSANATATASGTAARFSVLGDVQTLGQAGGSQTHMQVIDEMPAHTHTLPMFSSAPGGAGSEGGNANLFNKPTSSAGGSLPHNNVQPTFILNKIIFAGV